MLQMIDCGEAMGSDVLPWSWRVPGPLHSHSTVDFGVVGTCMRIAQCADTTALCAAAGWPPP